MISRRKLLLGCLAGCGSLAALRFGLCRPESAVVAVLRKRLSYLTLDTPGLLAFAQEFTAAGTMTTAKLRVIAALGPLYEWLPAEENMPNAVRHGEERIVTAYLLSSDFFTHSPDERMPVQYVGLYDPWTGGKACSNPFPRMQPDGEL